MTDKQIPPGIDLLQFHGLDATVDPVNESILALFEQDMSWKEIAGHVSLTAATVKRRFEKAKENYTIRQERDRIIWQLRSLSGVSVETIAGAVGLSASGVRRILTKYSKAAKESFDDRVAFRVEMQLTQLDYMFQELKDSWEQSKKPGREVVEKGDALDVDKDGKKRMAQKSTVTTSVKVREGDPAYLKHAMEVLGDIRDLIGLSTPQRIAFTDPSGTEQADMNQAVYAVLAMPDNGRGPVEK